MKRLGWGAGSIIGPRADGRYEVRISLGSVDGKRRRVTARADTPKDARAKLAELQARYGKSRGNAAAPKLSDYLEAWVSGRANALEAKTIRNYRFGIALIAERLGHVRIDRLDHEQIDAAIRGLREDGKGKRTLQVAYDTLRAALNWAVKRDRLITANPIAGVERPTSEREIDFLTRTEAKALIATVADDPYRALFHVALALGLRLGEILGLHWREIDLDGATLTVTRSLKETRAFGKPKSKTSRRRIDLPPSIVRELRAHKKRNRYRKTDLVFTTTDSTPLHPSNFERRHFHPAIKRAGIRKIRFHDLRHTCATLLLSGGVNAKVVQELLGHSSIRVTLDLYSHVMPGMGRAAAEKMDELLA